jgi:hypothetical protein
MPRHKKRSSPRGLATSWCCCARQEQRPSRSSAAPRPRGGRGGRRRGGRHRTECGAARHAPRRGLHGGRSSVQRNEGMGCSGRPEGACSRARRAPRRPSRSGTQRTSAELASRRAHVAPRRLCTDCHHTAKRPPPSETCLTAPSCATGVGVGAVPVPPLGCRLRRGTGAAAALAAVRAAQCPQASSRCSRAGAKQQSSSGTARAGGGEGGHRHSAAPAAPAPPVRRRRCTSPPPPPRACAMGDVDSSGRCVTNPAPASRLRRAAAKSARLSFSASGPPRAKAAHARPRMPIAPQWRGGAIMRGRQRCTRQPQCRTAG